MNSCQLPAWKMGNVGKKDPTYNQTTPYNFLALLKWG